MDESCMGTGIKLSDDWPPLPSLSLMTRNGSSSSIPDAMEQDDPHPIQSFPFSESLRTVWHRWRFPSLATLVGDHATHYEYLQHHHPITQAMNQEVVEVYLLWANGVGYSIKYWARNAVKFPWIYVEWSFFVVIVRLWDCYSPCPTYGIQWPNHLEKEKSCEDRALFDDLILEDRGVQRERSFDAVPALCVVIFLQSFDVVSDKTLYHHQNTMTVGFEGAGESFKQKQSDDMDSW